MILSFSKKIDRIMPTAMSIYKALAPPSPIAWLNLREYNDFLMIHPWLKHRSGDVGCAYCAKYAPYFKFSTIRSHTIMSFAEFRVTARDRRAFKDLVKQHENTTVHRSCTRRYLAGEEAGPAPDYVPRSKKARRACRASRELVKHDHTYCRQKVFPKKRIPKPKGETIREKVITLLNSPLTDESVRKLYQTHVAHRFHITRHIAEGLTTENCCFFYRLAAEAENEPELQSLTETIVKFVADIGNDLRTICMSDGFARLKAEDMKNLLVRAMGLNKVKIEEENSEWRSNSHDSNSLDQDSNSMEQNSNLIRQDSNLMEQDSNSMGSNSNSLDQDSNFMEQNSNLMRQDSNLKEQNSNSMEQDSNLMSQNSNLMRQDSNLNHNNSNLIGQDSSSIEQDSKLVKQKSDSTDKNLSSANLHSNSIEHDSNFGDRDSNDSPQRGILDLVNFESNGISIPFSNEKASIYETNASSTYESNVRNSNLNDHNSNFDFYRVSNSKDSNLSNNEITNYNRNHSNQMQNSNNNNNNNQNSSLNGHFVNDNSNEVSTLNYHREEVSETPNVVYLVPNRVSKSFSMHSSRDGSKKVANSKIKNLISNSNHTNQYSNSNPQNFRTSNLISSSDSDSSSSSFSNRTKANSSNLLSHNSNQNRSSTELKLHHNNTTVEVL